MEQKKINWWKITSFALIILCIYLFWVIGTITIENDRIIRSMCQLDIQKTEFTNSLIVYLNDFTNLEEKLVEIDSLEFCKDLLWY